MQKLQRNYMDYEDNNPFEATNPNMRAPVQPAAQGIFSGPFNLGQPYQAPQPVQPAQPFQLLPTQNLVQQVVGQPTAPQVNANGDQLSGLNNYGLTPLNFDASKFNPDSFSASSMEDYFAKNPINIDQNSFNNTFGGFDLNGGLKLNPPAEQTRLNNLDTVANPLVQQILGQGNTGKWTGQGYGSAEANARDMAKILAGIGITDIKQFGKFTKTGINETVTPDGRGGFVDQRGNPVDPKLVTPQLAGESEGGYYTEYVAPVGSKEVFGNKLTKQEVPNTYSERQTGNFFGGTFEGKGNTGYGVQFDEQGNPYFYTQGASSSDIGKIAPLLSIASLIPGVAPFAQGLNALIAAKQGNILGAISGAAGLGGLTNVANAANFAGALKSGNPLGIISSGANLGGVDLGGMVDASGVRDLTKVGNYDITDALKAAQTIKAIKSGDPASIISAVGGYLNKEPSEPTTGFANPDEFVPLPEVPTRSRFADKEIPGITEEINPFDIPSIGGNPMDLLPQLPSLSGEPESFNSAFAKARANGQKTFDWKGRPYTTDLAPAKQPTYDSVGGGRGGQGGATAEELARYNAVRGNAPQSDIAKFVSSIFPSAEGSMAPYYAGAGRGVQGGPTAQDLSEYEAQKNLGPYIGYKNAFNMKPKMGDVNQLPDPRTYAAVTGFMGTSPDEQGFSVLHPDYQGIKSAGEAGFYGGVGAQLNPLFRGMGKAIANTRNIGNEVGAVRDASKFSTNSNRFSSDHPVFESYLKDYQEGLPKLLGGGKTADQKIADKAVDAFNQGDSERAFRILESSYNAKRDLQNFSKKIGFDEIGVTGGGAPKYVQGVDRDFVKNKGYDFDDPSLPSDTYKYPVYKNTPEKLAEVPGKMFTMIQEFPDNVFRLPAVQDAFKAARYGNGEEAYKLLESNPAAKKAMLDYADKHNFRQVSNYENRSSAGALEKPYDPSIDAPAKQAPTGDGSMYVNQPRLTADPMKMFKMIDKFPKEVYQSPTVQEALKAAASGDGVKAMNLLESSPTARKAMLEYADKGGYSEISKYKDRGSFNLDNRPDYIKKQSGGYSQRKGGGMAAGGLASLTKKR